MIQERNENEIKSNIIIQQLKELNEKEYKKEIEESTQTIQSITNNFNISKQQLNEMKIEIKNKKIDEEILI